MNELPPNCPLTPEQFARLPIEMQTSETMIWVKDAQSPDPATMDAINAVCNPAVLTLLVPLYFATPTAALPVPQPDTHPTTSRAALPEGAAHGR